MIAIAATSRNGVIGRDGRLPWHLPEELRGFRRATLGHAVLMGRRTFAALGDKPLVGRLNLVATRHPGSLSPLAAGVEIIPDLAAFRPELYEADGRQVFVAGGAEVYQQMLPRCAELLLTLVHREVTDGDTFFPPFGSYFQLAEVLLTTPEFEVRRYVNAAPAGSATTRCSPPAGLAARARTNTSPTPPAAPTEG